MTKASENKLWKYFSLYIRLRDTDENGFGKCITCGRVLHFKKGDCGHGIPRQHKSTKYSEMNNALQCKPCNGFEGGKREVFKQRIDERYGPGTWDKLELASKSVCKRGAFEYEVMAKYYKDKVEKLKKQKGVE